jgi:hypothetical protein
MPFLHQVHGRIECDRIATIPAARCSAAKRFEATTSTDGKKASGAGLFKIFFQQKLLENGLTLFSVCSCRFLLFFRSLLGNRNKFHGLLLALVLFAR